MKITRIKETELYEFESGSVWTATQDMTNPEIRITLHTRDDNTQFTVIEIDGWNKNGENVIHKVFVEGKGFPKINTYTA